MFSTPPFEGELFKREVIQKGSYFFNVIFSLLTDKISFQTVVKLRSKDETYSVRDELPGELFEGGRYFFDVGAGRGS